MNPNNKLQEELERLKQEIIQQEKLANLGQLTAGIMHEIRNPLNFVNNFTKLSFDLIKDLLEIVEEFQEKKNEDLIDELIDTAKCLDDNLKKIDEHGQRAQRIVQGMLIQASGKVQEPIASKFNLLVEDYTKLAYHGVRGENSAFNAELIMNFDAQIKLINIVPQQFSRVILNLVNNSCYALYEKKTNSGEAFSPQIIVSTKKTEGFVVTTIFDNGTGISDENIKKIFDAFFTTKPVGKGTGLGLSMSYDIITNIHKGKIEVESKVNEYTRFIITIPDNLK